MDAASDLLAMYNGGLKDEAGYVALLSEEQLVHDGFLATKRRIELLESRVRELTVVVEELKSEHYRT